MDTAPLEGSLTIRVPIKSAKVHTLDPEILLLFFILQINEVAPMQGNSLQHHKSERLETT